MIVRGNFEGSRLTGFDIVMLSLSAYALVGHRQIEMYFSEQIISQESTI